MWIVVVEPYYDGSHRAWADGYATHSSHDVDVIGHRGSFWKWRMQGAALTLARDLQLLVDERHATPDAVIVSDMTDVAAFIGLARAALGRARIISYFHENQLTYPLAPGALPDLSYAIKNWLSMAAADEVWFNSSFHRDQLTRALPGLLGSMPDHRHTHLIDEVMDRSIVMPVGIHVDSPVAATPEAGTLPPIVLWNQRWEYDKDPARFFAAIDRAVDRGTEFRLAIAGQNFRRQPREFEAARTRHRERLVHFGEADRVAYRELLAQAHIVVSTARHEFFGIAVAEAIAAGSVPVLPNDLAYPELVGDDHRHLLYDSDDELDLRFDEAVRACRQGRRTDELSRRVAERYSWPAVAAEYDDRIDRLISSRPSRGTSAEVHG